MNRRSLIGWSLLISLAVWAVFSWPLPRHAFTGIGSSAHNTEKGHVRRMIPGDHLQLLYHFWLMGDMLSGRTPWWKNVYEFYNGRDVPYKETNTYYVPFSLFYAVGNWVGGRAFGWNLSGFISIWLTYLCTLLLVRRYTTDRLLAWGVALVAILLPYRWITLLGGSPTGYGMMCVPLLLLGLDVAVRDGKWWGGALAGFAFLLAYPSDAHVFFFSALMIPAWCIVAFWLKEDFDWRNRRHYWLLVRGLLPLVAFGLVALALAYDMKQGISQSAAAGGRTIKDVLRFSPEAKGFFAWHARGMTSHIFVGCILPLTILAGWGVWAARARRDLRQTWRPLVLMSLLAAGVGGAMLLAAGPNGPLGAKGFTLVCKLMPPYKMIRQPAKIYCVMPLLLAMGTAMSVRGLALWIGPARARIAGLVLVGLALIEFRAQVSPTVCLLATEQGAYRAVAEDARSAGQEPRALGIVLWPGDSHWSALYGHYASLYRIRLMNGYRAAIPVEYIDDVFFRFESINAGQVTDSQLDELLRRGVGYLLLHEDAFPEKVSPYPVCFTLKQLLANPRLMLLKQADRVWAFQILQTGQPGSEVLPEWNVFFPTRLWEMERMPGEWTVAGTGDDAGGGGYVTLKEQDSAAWTRATGGGPAPGQRWMVRTRGRGSLRAATRINGRAVDEQALKVDSTEWQWRDVPLPVLTGFSTNLSLGVQWQDGAVDLDLVLLAAGEWKWLEPGEQMDLPAPCFFHAGYTDMEEGSVRLDPSTEPGDAILYGPRMPMPPGSYEIELVMSSPALPGTKLGKLIANEGSREVARQRVLAGQPNRLVVVLGSNLPLQLSFVYSRNASMRVKKVIIRRQ